ncbi:helix-turn-helix domain-containing protein [Myroides odoratimimus]|uniref:helix-turn-helix domain-containing protein n=1 Tax=Myroides odoratimimus TaxID=76832 RepID=UPI00091DC4F1|nr:helix-turn-helix domain-containing protein [Myroides odoratimimus]SHM74067.1 Helix-turn-helix domain-containing protein [Myroides odoratimimus subsp. xuanwuensis]
MNVELITKEDLEQFKTDIINEIRRYSPFNRKKDEQAKQWIKSFKVRKLLGISPGTLQNMRLKGTIPYKKIGGLIFYRYEDIVEMMNTKA